MLVKIQSVRTGKMVRKKVPVHGLSSPVAVFAAADALASVQTQRYKGPAFADARHGLSTGVFKARILQTPHGGLLP